MLLCYITDRKQFPGGDDARTQALLRKIAEAARCGVDLIQLREKDLPGRKLESLARSAVQGVRENSDHTRLLISSRSDVAIAVGADGVHLPSNDLSPSQVQEIWQRTSTISAPVIGVSCHTLEDVQRAVLEKASIAVFAPVFEKAGTRAQPAGLANLREACKLGIPVLALGGVTLENARPCLEAGAAGLAGIRLFQQNRIADVVQVLRP